jgi:hypothetical protein
LIALPEREPNRYRQGAELRDALSVRDDCRVEISIERQEGLKRARLCLELAVQEGDELSTDVLVEDEATDLELEQPAELPRRLSEMFGEPVVVGIGEQPDGLGWFRWGVWLQAVKGIESDNGPHALRMVQGPVDAGGS